MLKEFGPYPAEDGNMVRHALQEDNCGIVQGVRRVYF